MREDSRLALEGKGARFVDLASATLAMPPGPKLLLKADASHEGLPADVVGLLLGEGGIGKTWFCLELAAALARGPDAVWCGMKPTKQGRTLCIFPEESVVLIAQRWHTVANQEAALAERVTIITDWAPRVGNGGDWEAFIDAIEPGQYDLIIIDPLAQIATPGAETDNHEATQLVNAVRELKRKSGACVLLTHHTNKTGRGPDAATGTAISRGSSALTDAVRWVATMQRKEDGIAFRVVKSNGTPEGPERMMKRTNGRPMTTGAK